MKTLAPENRAAFVIHATFTMIVVGILGFFFWMVISSAHSENTRGDQCEARGGVFVDREVCIDKEAVINLP